MPSRSSLSHNIAWLRSRGYAVTEEECYIAPHYTRAEQVADDELLTILAEKMPTLSLLHNPYEDKGFAMELILLLALAAREAADSTRTQPESEGGGRARRS